ncbi:MAG: histidine phosphatase family protein [Anaerolineae bacterium]|nr:histidine phosphatase family protein [Anaerolineae bacterium]
MNANKTRTQIILVRHGQTAWNEPGERIRGQSDVPLSEEGLAQARATARYIAARWPLTAVYSSPLSRAMETAQAIAEAQGLEVHPLDGLMDLSFGEWEGLTIPEVQARYPDLWRAWQEAPHTVRFPGGESLDDVRSRCTQALREVVERHPGETVAMVAHRVVNQVLLCVILGLGNDHFWHVLQDPCAVSRIEWNGKFYRLALMNDTSHLWRPL